MDQSEQKKMRNDEFSEKLRQAKLSLREFSRLSGQSISAVYKWNEGVNPTPNIVFWALDQYIARQAIVIEKEDMTDL